MSSTTARRTHLVQVADGRTLRVLPDEGHISIVKRSAGEIRGWLLETV